MDGPGNVRELEKCVRRAAILADEAEVIGAELLPVEVLESSSGLQRMDQGGDFKGTIEDMEKRLVIGALERHGLEQDPRG